MSGPDAFPPGGVRALLNTAWVTEPTRRALQAKHRGQQKTVRLDAPLRVDFQRGTLRHGDAEYRFTVLGDVAQQLIVAGGLEAIVAQRIAAVQN